LLRAITIPDRLIDRVAAGGPQVRLEEIGAAQVAAEPGRPLELVGSRGEFLGRGIADPENGLIRILTRDPDEPLDQGFLLKRAGAAIALRRSLGLLDGRSACRLVNGEGDGLSGFAVDAYGPYLVSYVYARGLKEWGRRLAAAIAAALGPGGPEPEGVPLKGILQKVRTRESARPGKPEQMVVWGEEPPEKWVVHEGDLSFEVHLLAGLNVGLFSDMRDHRQRIGRFARSRSVLNTFSYTGALSVAAALSGAREVTSVDLSSGVLKWAQENFRLNGLDPGLHRFETGDVLRFLTAARKEGRRYDMVILDPPTYSAARAAGWSMRKDYPELIAAALEVIPEGGILWVSANVHRESGENLEAQIARGSALARRRPRVLEVGGLPPDYPTPAAYPEGRYLKLYILAV
jgi:23S rRNA (cytosine1962-C5)-methyltransferase